MAEQLSLFGSPEPEGAPAKPVPAAASAQPKPAPEPTAAYTSVVCSLHPRHARRSSTTTTPRFSSALMVADMLL